MFSFFLGNGKLPSSYDIAYICDTLKLSYTELEKEPYFWVVSMMDYYEQKYKAEEHRIKIEKAKAKNR